MNIITKSNGRSNLIANYFAKFFDNSSGEKAGDTSLIYEVSQIPKENRNNNNKSIISKSFQALKTFDRFQRETSKKLKFFRKTNLETAKKLEVLGKKEDAEKLKKCSTSAYKTFCRKRIWNYFLKDRCNLPCCGFCKRTKSNREAKRTAKKLEFLLNNDSNLKPVLLTLTQKTSSKSLKSIENKLVTDFDKLRNRKIFKNSVVCGRYQVDPKVSKGLWQSHLHIILLVTKDSSEDFTQKALSRTWKEISKDSLIVDIRTIDADIQSLTNTIAYTIKVGNVKDMSDKQLLELLETKGEKKGATFGIIRGLKLNEIESYELEEKDFNAEFFEKAKQKRIGNFCDCGCNSYINGETVTFDALTNSLEGRKTIDFVRKKVSNGIKPY